MGQAVDLVEVWRGDILESVHRGHAAICDDRGQIVQAWGDPETLIFPRSSCKMVQALPLVESGAADAAGLGTEQLALACASHQGAALHTDRVSGWLAGLGLSDEDFRCGAHMPYDVATAHGLIRTDESPCQMHNNCSGKHSGFLTLNRHLKAGPDYIDLDHPVQMAVKTAFEDVTDQVSPGYGIDGCSAPNFATTLHGLARAMGFFASAGDRSDTRSNAAARLVQAMVAYPELVGGEGKADTELMRATGGRAAIKTGAEGVYVAIIPEKRLGIALKIVDGATRASECAIAAILIKLGMLEAAHPSAQKRLNAPLINCRGVVCGHVRPAPTLT